jgi:hypothetical protein
MQLMKRELKTIMTIGKIRLNPILIKNRREKVEYKINTMFFVVLESKYKSTHLFFIKCFKEKTIDNSFIFSEEIGIFFLKFSKKIRDELNAVRQIRPKRKNREKKSKIN